MTIADLAAFVLGFGWAIYGVGIGYPIAFENGNRFLFGWSTR